jgi:hypothetical protein
VSERPSCWADKGQTTSASTILIREVLPVYNADIESADSASMSIRSRAYLRAIKKAEETHQCFFFVHSHPLGQNDFSTQDNMEERALFRTAHVRIHGDLIHGSIVFSAPDRAVGRVWLQDGTSHRIERIRIIGDRLSFILQEQIADEPLEFFDRQARAFTTALQSVLHRLHVGVVGVGGTGSAVCEQLIRLGVGALTIIDNGRFELSNVSRVYGSSVFDESMSKVNIAERLSAGIGLGTVVNKIHGHLSFESVARRLVECDVVFGCTDDEFGRSILNRLSLWYYVPVFDLGVQIDTFDDARRTIRSIQGRVTVLSPGGACLFCRNRISADRIRAEAIEATDPNEAARLRRERYLVGVDEPAPAVISFTTSVAAAGVSELLHRLTGYKGADRRSTEILLLLDQDRVRTTAVQPKADCFCSDDANWGRGDSARFLDMIWRRE